MPNPYGNKGLPAEEVTKILKLHQEGKSHFEICKTTNHALTTILNVLKSYESYEDERPVISAEKRKKIQASDKPKIMKMYNEGRKLSEICAEIGVTYPPLRKFLTKEGVYTPIYNKRLNEFTREDLQRIQGAIDNSDTFVVAARKAGCAQYALRYLINKGILQHNSKHKQIVLDQNLFIKSSDISLKISADKDKPLIKKLEIVKNQDGDFEVCISLKNVSKVFKNYEDITDIINGKVEF